MKTATREKPAPTTGRAKEPTLYESTGFVMVRAPLLPVDAYFDLRSESRAAERANEPRVQCALAVGSTSLLHAMRRAQLGVLSQRDLARMKVKLRRYLVRLSTRPTPYGLFAGVALARWGAQTDLEITATNARTRTRPDMGWLLDLVFQAEDDERVRKRVRVKANPLAVVNGGRVLLAERAPSKVSANEGPVSLRATGALKRALALAHKPIAYGDLATALCAEVKGATAEKVDKLLSDLWQQTLLVTDLRPPLTIDDPAGYVAAKLHEIPEAAEIYAKLERLRKAAARWDAAEAAEKMSHFEELLAGADVPLDGSKQIPVQSDMALALTGCVHQQIAHEAERAASLLVRLSPAPRGSAMLAAYRQAFLSKYGHEREVNLLELLDTQRGLGPHTNYGYAHTGPDEMKASERSRMLLKLACDALRTGKRSVELNEKTIEQLATCASDEQNVPLSLDLNVLVAAPSRTALDAGEFTLVVGPNLGAQAAGRNLGRFASMLGAEADEALREIAEAEEARTPDEVWAELVYLPNDVRMANVTIRPVFREYQAVFGTAAAPDARVIPLDELLVGVEDKHLYVRWRQARKRVHFSAGHMLTNYRAPAVVRFLADLASDARAIFTSFDWGPAERFPFLPRVQIGRIVLRPAEWRVYKETLDTNSAEAFRNALLAWREQWDVPLSVYLTVGDNRLILDFGEPADVDEFLSEARKLGGDRSLLLQEVMPSFEELWLSGAEGHYYSELVVSLIRRQWARHKDERAERQQQAPAIGVRNRPPGSEWLFTKLYCARHVEDEIVAGPLLTFAERTLEAKLMDAWFFIRYADPQPHLRVRFRGTPKRLATHLFAHVCEWANGLVEDGSLDRFVFDTYEREVERYGGSDGMAAAEDVFAIDSLYAARILKTLHAAPMPEMAAFLALSVDDLLASFGLNDAERLAWCGGQIHARTADIGADYRKLKNELRAAVGNPEGFLESINGGAALRNHLTGRRKALEPVAERLLRIANEGRLTETLGKMLASFVHLHLNRLMGGGSTAEHRLLSLLLRTRESLKQAPVRRSN